jgi:hypothetical protein
VPTADDGWVRLYDEPGEPVNVRDVAGQFGPGLDQYGTMRVEMIVAGDDVRKDELVGLIMHPELEGVAVGATAGTPAGNAPQAELTAILREFGWRWATEPEVAELVNGYVVPGLSGIARATDGAARADALRRLT